MLRIKFMASSKVPWPFFCRLGDLVRGLHTTESFCPPWEETIVVTR